VDWWVWLESRPRAGGISCPFLNPFLVDFFDPYFFQSPGTPPLGGSRPAPSDLKKRPGVHAYGPTFGDSPGGWRFLSPARWYSSVGIRKWGGGASCVMVGSPSRVQVGRPSMGSCSRMRRTTAARGPSQTRTHGHPSGTWGPKHRTTDPTHTCDPHWSHRGGFWNANIC